MSDKTIKFGVLAGMALLLLLFLIFLASGTDSPPTGVDETAMPTNIYMPKMEFETLSETDNAALQMCRQSANKIVYEFSLAASSILVRQDEKLRSLGHIAFAECLKLYSLHVAEIE